MPDISMCVAAYKRHRAPNLSTLSASLSEACGQLSAELIVVLNGISAQRADAPSDAEIVRFELNRGVAVAWNAAAERASAPVLCFVNDDVVLGPRSVELQYSAFERAPDAGVVGPVGTRWDLASARHLAYVDLDGLARGELRECEVVSGFLFATPAGVYREIGGFDEAYTPCGYEEVDYCTAVRMMAGRRCFAVAGVDAAHEFGVSARRPWSRVRYDGRSESLRSISRRNRRHYLAKWWGSGEPDRDPGGIGVAEREGS